MSQTTSGINPSLVHTSLNAILNGKQVFSVDDIKVVHFRGIPYASVPRRFAKATLKDDWNGEHLDCRQFGPQCPQNEVDVSYLLRIPEKLSANGKMDQDEFRCLNLNVSVPVINAPEQTLLPVLIWIHGGSQVVSFPPVSHKLSDTTSLISKSCSLESSSDGNNPIITVTFNYRLNIFGFGDGIEKNLALKDQRLAMEWVVKHIHGFGGDKDNITLGGESAGAVYAHAHLCTGAPVRRGILQSGSLYLSPPLPYAIGDSLISRLSAEVHENSQKSLTEAQTSDILQSLRDLNINTLWIQEEPDLVGWKDRLNDVEEVIIGDVEYESIIWRSGLEHVGAEEISAAFDNDVEYGPILKHLYGISPTRATSSRIGALDFITDARFALPVETISQTRRRAGKKTYQYLFDQPNPWQNSSRAHHGVDLLFLFASVELPFSSPSAEKVADVMRNCWIAFINGREPWYGSSRYAFGPFGICREIDDAEFATRRREKHWEILRMMKPSTLAVIFGNLATGRISLIN